MSFNPCLRCGACCAFFRVSFYWGETDDSTPGGVPLEMTEKLNDFRVAMRTIPGSSGRCVSLNGFIGRSVSCSIYERRSSVCRGFEPSWQNKAPNPACDKARRAWELEPLKPESWLDDHNFPKAA